MSFVSDTGAEFLFLPYKSSDVKSLRPYQTSSELIKCHSVCQEPLRLFALEPVDVCLLSQLPNEAQEGWAELEYTEAPEVEGFGKDQYEKKENIAVPS